MTRDIGVALIGCGGIARTHAEALRGVPGARLVAVTDVDPDRARAFGETHGVAPLEVSAILSSEDVHMVVICTPAGTHADLGSLAVAHGKHVLLEKPIDVDLTSADALIAAAAEAGVHLGVVSQHRFDDAMIALTGAVASGELGPLLFGSVTVDWWREQSYYTAPPYRGTRAMEGGALLNQGIHYVDLLLWVFGPARRVYARMGTVAHEMECEDLAQLTIDFASGATATLRVTTAAYPGFAERMSVTGERGTVEVVGTDIATWALRDGSPTAEPQVAPMAGVEAHRRQLADFVESIRDGRPPAVSGVDARAALEMVQAAYDSNDLGLPVEITATAGSLLAPIA